jgi:pre-mRNA-splicing factor ATP-dependent RNA helicase DHX38/PRP16
VYLQYHTFKQPVRPMEPPTPRSSLLGLDRLAQEKRFEAANGNEGGARKKPRLVHVEPFFKGKNFSIFA